MSNLALTYKSLGKYADAEKLQIKVLGLRNKLLGEEHPYTISAMNNLAITYATPKKNADAEKLQVKVLDLKKQTLWRRTPRYH